MEEEDSKICENCKREIPAVNFMVHKAHCARNIKMCPVCKEPLPQADLQEHHEKLHKLLPCKHCGESVCGTDLEDHIRDSCGHTIKSCRFCELELPRRELPAHEGYCGVRTEQCQECREWVMIKYRQLHVDSNHGFLRLDDDPIPQPKRELPKSTNIFKPTNITNFTPLASTSNGFRPTATKTTNLDQARPKTEIRYFNDGPSELPSVSRPQSLQLNGVLPKAPLKRTNDQPQINTAVAAASKVNKELCSRGAVKKRPAPPPPDPKRDLALARALQRQQDEEHCRAEQTAYNLSVGLPPVLSAAAKLDKLRKMDALHSRELQEPDYKNRLQGRVWMDRDVPTGNVLGSSNSQGDNLHLEANRRKRTLKQETEPQTEDRRNDFKDVKPMSPQEFMNRFQEMQLRKEAKREDRSERGGDRFSEIKSSLRELRRGLNEVTAPYNSNNADPSNIYSSRGRPRSERPEPPERPEEEPQLPCEFCSMLVPADQLVLHQTGCRPDLAQYRRSSSPGSPSPPTPAHDVPVIPCEFCTESLPLYLISEHQERCGRDANLLYPD